MIVDFVCDVNLWPRLESINACKLIKSVIFYREEFIDFPSKWQKGFRTMSGLASFFAQ